MLNRATEEYLLKAWAEKGREVEEVRSSGELLALTLLQGTSTEAA